LNCQKSSLKYNEHACKISNAQPLHLVKLEVLGTLVGLDLSVGLLGHPELLVRDKVLGSCVADGADRLGDREGQTLLAADNVERSRRVVAALGFLDVGEETVVGLDEGAAVDGVSLPRLHRAGLDNLERVP
jgi:hypothetical protein